MNARLTNQMLRRACLTLLALVGSFLCACASSNQITHKGLVQLLDIHRWIVPMPKDSHLEWTFEIREPMETEEPDRRVQPHKRHPNTHNDEPAAGHGEPAPATESEEQAAKRLELHQILDRAISEHDGVHDACGGLDYVGDTSSVPHLIRVLMFFGDAELPLPPGVGLICTQWHCVHALEDLTGVRVGVSYESWKRWWETTHPDEPLAEPPKLEARDFTVAGIKEGMNQAEVEAVLGPSDGTIRTSQDLGLGLEGSGWSFGDLWVMAADSHSVTGFRLSGPKHKTFRGLSVGDSVARVRDFYGTPGEIRQNKWLYLGPGNDNFHALKLEIEEGKVSEIFIGWDLFR